MKSTFENHLIAQCAPTLAGVKPASLFPYTADKGENMEEVLRHWNRQLSGKGICFVHLKESNNRHLILAYRPKSIERLLGDKNASSFLEAYGYYGCSKPEDYIEILSCRMNDEPSFPHEIGVFLGYPLQDVTGFIKNEGKNARCLGCWKVYGDQGAAKRCFQRFSRCTSIYKRLFDSGKTILQLTVAA